MIPPPQATEKAEDSSGETDRAGTCAHDVDSQRWLKRPLVGKTGFRTKDCVIVLWPSEKRKHVREHSKQSKPKQPLA